MDLLILIWFISVVASAVVATKKGEPYAGTFLGLVLGPLGLLVCLLSGYANRRRCPYCAELIMKKAVVCPHCHRAADESCVRDRSQPLLGWRPAFGADRWKDAGYRLIERLDQLTPNRRIALFAVICISVIVAVANFLEAPTDTEGGKIARSDPPPQQARQDAPPDSPSSELNFTKPLQNSAQAADSDIQKFVDSIRSANQVKTAVRNDLLGVDSCGTGSCENNNATDICDHVAALDIKLAGAISDVSRRGGGDFNIDNSDLQLFRAIWSACKPTSYQFWNYGRLLHVWYQPDPVTDAKVRAALGVATARSAENSEAKMAR